MYGPSMYPHSFPRRRLKGSSDPDKIWKAFDENEASRRTIYAFVKRSMVVPMLEVLDFCDTARSSARRLNTSVATAGADAVQWRFREPAGAATLPQRLRREAGRDPDRQVELAYRLALRASGRPRPRRRRDAGVSRVDGGDRRPGADVPRDFQPERVRLPGLMTRVDERLPNPTPCGRTRREFLWEVGGGFAGLALIDLLRATAFSRKARLRRQTS